MLGLPHRDGSYLSERRSQNLSGGDEEKAKESGISNPTASTAASPASLPFRRCNGPDKQANSRKSRHCALSVLPKTSSVSCCAQQISPLFATGPFPQHPVSRSRYAGAPVQLLPDGTGIRLPRCELLGKRGGVEGGRGSVYVSVTTTRASSGRKVQ